jgi:hypothetical protein
MQKVPTNSAEAIERFGVKSASLGTILPTVALPALGAFAGRRFMPNSDLGGMIGGIAGGVAGQEVKEMVEHHQQARQQQLAMGVPMGAPYAIDSTMQDIPSWALQGASYLRPSLKFSMLLRTLEGKGA